MWNIIIKRMPVFATGILFLLNQNAIAQTNPAFNPSLNRVSSVNKNWQPGGIFHGESTEKELLSVRTEYTKKFDKGNGIVDVIFGGPFHYFDNNGAWQDINLDIKPLNSGSYVYGNNENKFMSQFTQKAEGGVNMEYKNKSIQFGITPSISSLNWSPAVSANQNLLVDENRITYKNLYTDIDLSYGLTTNAILHKLTFNNKLVFEGIQSNQTVRVEETVELPKNAVLADENGSISNGRKIKGNLFVIVDNDTLYTIHTARAWDAAFTGNILEFGSGSDLPNGVIDIETSVEFIQPYKFKLIASIPAKWLLATDRIYPVVFDPTVGVGNQTSFSSSYRYPFNTCRQQRVSQILFLKNDINAGNINTTGTITQVEFYRNTNNPIANNNVRLQMQEVAWNEMTTSTLTSAGFTNCYGPTNQNFTTGGTNSWRPLILTTPFTYTNTKNLLIEVSFNNSPNNTSGCSCTNTGPGGYWGWYNSPYAGHRWAYSNSAAPPPSGGDCEYNNSPERNPAYGYFIPATRITINTTGGCTPISITSHPSSQTVSAPAQAQFSVAVSGTTPSYVWEYSTNGGAAWSNVPALSPYTGNTSNQLTINPTNATMNGYRYRCKVSNTCTTPSPVTSNTGVLTINAPGCTTVLTPATSPSIPAAGGNGSFAINVTPNTCSWSATETLTWVTITSPLSGTNDATLTYTVAANTGTARSGIISVNGQNYTINQLGAAAPTTYTISGIVIENGSQPLPGISMSTTPAQGAPVTTDAQGYYSITVPLNFTGLVKPTSSVYTFMPLSRPVSSTNFSNKDFNALGVGITISNSVIPPWQREGDDYNGSVTVRFDNTNTNLWHLEADVYDASNNHVGNVRFPPTTNLTYNFSTQSTAGQLLKNLSLNTRTVKYAAVFNANTAIQAYPGASTDIIEKKLDKETVVFYNPNENIDFRLKYIPNTSGVKISFTRVEKTSNANDNIISGIASTQLGLNRHYILNIFSPSSNLATVKPGEFNYKIEYLGTAEVETGIFSLTKVGVIKNNGNSKVVILINGYQNEAEVNAKIIRNLPVTTSWDSSDVSFSIVPYLCGFGIDAWYIGQPNTNSVKRNAFDIAKSLEKIISLTPGTNDYFLICHSKGGLDTRALLGSTNSNFTKLNVGLDGKSYIFTGSTLDGKISKVVFVATPHKGALAAYIGSILQQSPATIDLEPNSDIIKELKKTNMPMNISFANLTGITNVSRSGDGVVSVNSSEFPFLGNSRKAVQMYQFDYNGDNSGTSGFHTKVHKTKNLSNYLDWTCDEILTNKQKIKRFLLNGYLEACQINSFNYFSFQASGSQLPGAKIITSLPQNSNNFLFGTTDEVGFVNVLGLKTKFWQNSFNIIASGYDRQKIVIDSTFINSNKLSIALIKENNRSNLVMYPQFSLALQNPILSSPTIKINVKSQNTLTYLINKQGTDSLFIPLALNNNTSNISLDTGYNRIIIKFCGIDTVVQIKELYYLPDTMMDHYAMNCSVIVPDAFKKSKMFVNNIFYKDIFASNTFKLLREATEIKFSKYGYHDTVFVVDTPATINLSMQPYSYSSIIDSTIFNFNSNINPQYWKTITVKNKSVTINKQVSVMQYDDPYSGMALQPQTRKFVFRKFLGTGAPASYKTAIALDQINTPDKDSVYMLYNDGGKWVKYKVNDPGITEYDPEVQKFEFDKLYIQGNETYDFALMQKQAPIMKDLDTIWHSGQTIIFPLSIFIKDPDSIKNDVTISSNDAKVVIRGNMVYVTAPINFTGNITYTLTGTHDFLDVSKTYIMKVKTPAVVVPTAFSPNRDGVNDVIRPNFLGKLISCHFTIFNRNGQKVYETTECTEGWNGRIRGAEQDPGAYVWMLSYQFEGEPIKQEKGTFVLLR